MYYRKSNNNPRLTYQAHNNREREHNRPFFFLGKMFIYLCCLVGVRKKIKKLIKLIKPEKNNWKNRTVKKNQLNRLEFWKNRPVRFDFSFISLKPKKPNRTEPEQKKPNQTGNKPSQTGKTKPNRKKTEPNRFEPVFVKKQTEPKPVGLNRFQLFFF